MAPAMVGLDQLWQGIRRRDERYRLTAFADERLPMPLLRAAVMAAKAQPYDDSDYRTNSIFIHVPKTGGTSFTNGLGLVHKPHVSISRFVARDPAFAAQAFKFAIVRNPWDRLHSAFHFLRGDRYVSRDDRAFASRYLKAFSDFTSFCKALASPSIRREIMGYFHFLPQMHWLCLPGSDTPYMDYVGRFETLGDSFAVIADKLGVSTHLPFLNRTDRPAYCDEYTAETRDIVAEIYAADIAAFGYTFDSQGAGNA